MPNQRKATAISNDERRFFDEFHEKYDKFILYIANKYDRPGIQAEDIRQEVVLRLMAHIETLRTLNHNQTCAYISYTVKSAFLDLERKENRYSHISMDTAMEELVGAEYELVPDLDLRQEIRRLRNGLTAREWLALKGKYVFGYSQEELGQLLDIAPDSVRMLLHRARKQSKQILSPEKVTGGGDDD